MAANLSANRRRVQYQLLEELAQLGAFGCIEAVEHLVLTVFEALDQSVMQSAALFGDAQPRLAPIILIWTAIHNARALHYSPSSKSPLPRPLLLNCYTSADAKPYTPHPTPTSHTYELVRGEPVQWAHHDPRPCQIPPDWSGGYTSIYAAQAGEDKSAGGMM